MACTCATDDEVPCFSCWEAYLADLDAKMASKRAEVEADLRELETCKLPDWIGRK